MKEDITYFFRNYVLITGGITPPLYLIDEPFVGLDPLGIRSLLEWMRKTKESSSSILMSSHILSAIEKYCDRFILLHAGKIATIGTLADIRHTAGLSAGSEVPLEEVFFALVQSGNTVWR